MYDLFVRGPLRGRITEQAALRMLKETFAPKLHFDESDPDTDAQFAVDIVVSRDARTVAGIQVKPVSYQRTAQYVRNSNAEKNRRFGYPVHYLYYDQSGNWENFLPLTKTLASLLPCSPLRQTN